MTDGVSLKLTPDSKTIIAMWTRDKKVALEGTIDSWLTRMLAWMLRETMKAFDDGKQPGGSPWPANPPWYAEWKTQFGSNKPGILSGDLRRSFAQNKKVDKAGKQASIGSTLPYARAILYGSRHTWAGVITGPGGRNPAWFMFHGIKPRPYFPTQKMGDEHAEDLFIQLAKQKGLVS